MLYCVYYTRVYKYCLFSINEKINFRCMILWNFLIKLLMFLILIDILIFDFPDSWILTVWFPEKRKWIGTMHFSATLLLLVKKMKVII